MSLDPGTPLGPYQLVVLIGAGGTGEAYKVSDSAAIDPTCHTFTRVPTEFDGDMHEPARLANGDIAALTASYRHSIWHYVPKPR
jgi:hypothetical protein